MQNTERFQVVVVGGGQGGLSVGYYLARQRIPFVILDASPRVGDSWRQRWDSLRLFSPAFYDGLPGLRFPAGIGDKPTKDQMGNYLEGYVSHFKLPVRSGVRVTRLSRQGEHFLVEAGEKRFEAKQVVVATGNYCRPRIPRFAAELDQGIVQFHSSAYRNLSQLAPGGVLIVGTGNSGAEIAIEAVKKHPTWLAGKESGQIPFRVDSFAGRFIWVHLIRALGHNILNVDTPIGRKVRPKMLFRATPLVRVKPKDLIAAGVERVARVIGVERGLPKLEDGSVLKVENVIWCTGFLPGLEWVELPIFGMDGEPLHDRGVVTREPGLYFVGLRFQYAMTSDLINGVGRDAKHVVEAIAERRKTTRAA
ncbi:MAG TPA: NAD(P)-binding domain-containing protein [Gemmatimonadales bacterium]|nr:NAD(P)-binding domain-containing protein [Gemmatimonadales bacterium]